MSNSDTSIKKLLVFKKDNFFNFFSILSISAFTLLLLASLVLYKFLYFIYFFQAINIWFIYSILSGFFLLSRLPLAYFYIDEHEKQYEDSEYPNVSFIIACKNEEKSIYLTIKSCLNSQYPGNMECIVIDDGSTDNTKYEIQRAVDDFSLRVRSIIFPVNRGKREAMSEGILISNNEIIVFVDSDSFIKKGALKNMIEHFMDDSSIGAVAGYSEVENAEVNVLTKMQSIRYAISFNIFKVAESIFGTVTCCPGCFSAYRRECLIGVYDAWRNKKFLGTRSTFGDDRSLTNFILKNWRVIYCRSARCSTIVPEKYKNFLNQQLRWKKSWIREGLVATKFMWKKNIIAGLSFYTNLLLPIFGPILIIRIIYRAFITSNISIFFMFVLGAIVIGFLFSLFLKIIYREKYWYYMPLFSLFYILVLVWQMPYAILKIRDTGWGTR